MPHNDANFGIGTLSLIPRRRKTTTGLPVRTTTICTRSRRNQLKLALDPRIAQNWVNAGHPCSLRCKAHNRETAMIVRYESDGSIVMITQNDHAQLSGLFAAHWGNATFEKPRPYLSLVRAAMFHDR